MAFTLSRFSLRTILFQILPVVITFLLLVISLALLSISTNDPQQSSEISNWLVPINVSVLSILSLLIIYNVVKAFRFLRSGKAGSRFTLRLMYAFTLLTILPVLVVSYFSLNFIGDRIDNWFNVKIEGALDDSLELARSSLEVRMRQHLFDLERMGKVLKDVDPLDYSSFIDSQLFPIGAYEIILLDNNKRVLVYSGNSSRDLFPHFPTEEIYRKVDNRGYMYQLEPAGEDGLFSRVALSLKTGISREKLTLTALFSFSDKEIVLAENVQDTYNQYQEISYQRGLIKKGFRMTLLLIMLLSILFSIWAAFLYSLRLTKPVRELLEGTMAVASGDLQKKITVEERDDFSLLARSFNTMTTRLSRAQKESEESRQQMKKQHDYLNLVLDNLSSGVITLDDEFIIRRINIAAEQLFLLPLREFKGQRLSTMFQYQDELTPLCDTVMPYLNNRNGENKEWQTETSLFLGGIKHTIVCRGAELPKFVDGVQGYVLVFDDISEVIQAEHDAAWSEVARRLAHEIKNPLTPIQLSAERLQRRLIPLLDEESADLLNRMSNTIVHQVDTMKKMVNAFSDYARTPELQLKNTNINRLITEIAELYQINQTHAKIKLVLEGSPTLTIDIDRMRQLVVNLIKNSLEAMAEESDNKIGATLTIFSTVKKSNDGKEQYVLSFIDNGTGIEDELLAHLFEPYKTTKIKGTGLGLAIVKRIIEEHDGCVIAENNANQGATLSVYLPLN